MKYKFKRAKHLTKFELKLLNKYLNYILKHPDENGRIENKNFNLILEYDYSDNKIIDINLKYRKKHLLKKQEKVCIEDGKIDIELIKETSKTFIVNFSKRNIKSYSAEFDVYI